MKLKKQQQVTLVSIDKKLDLMVSNQEDFQGLVVNHFTKIYTEMSEMRKEINDELRLIRSEIQIIDQRLKKVESKVDVKNDLKNEVEDLREKLNKVFTILKENGIKIA